MKTLFTTIALLILITIGLRAQESIKLKGQICNGINHMALRDCHIYVDGKVAGTISNFNGEFELQIPEKYLGRSLNISHVGFETFKQPISKMNGDFLEVHLMETAIELVEVVVVPNDEEIVDNAILSVENEFQNQEELIQAFYKVLLKKDKDHRVLNSVLSSN